MLSHGHATLSACLLRFLFLHCCGVKIISFLLKSTQQQQLPFSAPSDLPPEADFLDTSYVQTESSATSTPNVSPKASNHSAYSNLSGSDTGRCLSTEQEEGGNVNLTSFIVCPNKNSNQKVCNISPTAKGNKAQEGVGGRQT